MSLSPPRRAARRGRGAASSSARAKAAAATLRLRAPVRRAQLSAIGRHATATASARRRRRAATAERAPRRRPPTAPTPRTRARRIVALARLVRRVVGEDPHPIDGPALRFRYATTPSVAAEHSTSERDASVRRSSRAVRTLPDQRRATTKSAVNGVRARDGATPASSPSATCQSAYSKKFATCSQTGACAAQPRDVVLPPRDDVDAARPASRDCPVDRGIVRARGRAGERARRGRQHDDEAR